MKKLFSLLLTLICSFVVFMSGCISLHITLGDLGINENEQKQFETTYSSDETHHWFQQIGGSEQKDKEEHYNDSGRCVCGLYYDCPNLILKPTEVDGREGYEVYGYDSDVNPQYLHVKIPEYYQGEDDLSPLPILKICDYAFCGDGTVGVDPCSVKIKSVQIPNTVKIIGRNAFCHSDIEELIIPDSVESDLRYTAMYCSALKRVVIGNSVKRIKDYAFCNSNSLEEVIIGSKVEEIRQRTFIGNSQLKYIVLPASLVSIPEESYESGNAEGIEPLIQLFKNSGSPDIFLEITELDLQELTIQQKTRDLNGNIIEPSSSELTTYGFVEGWSGTSKIYFVGEWDYDENHKPVPKVEK